jgi:hypothetical protein
MKGPGQKINQQADGRPPATLPARRTAPMLLVFGLAVIAISAALLFPRSKLELRGSAKAASYAVSNAVSKGAVPTNVPLDSIGVAQAVMVTVDLDFGAKRPSIAEALTQVERRYEPRDGMGRTFSIIEAFGEPTPEGKLRVSMHVSTEKPGSGALVFKRTGETLWRSQITPATNSAAAKPSTPQSLTILLDNLQGRTLMVDGSNNPATLLAANLRDVGASVGSVWLDGAEMEASFIYSVCGCPVKVRARRVGDKMVRTKELPLIFPDDPAVVRVIEKLMGW